MLGRSSTLLSLGRAISRRGPFQTSWRRRPLSTSELTKSSTTEALPTSSSSSSATAPNIVRHGPGDGVIVLNVGGKEFLTLRSTVELNPVLRGYVHRAQANKEFVKGDSAIFIDRDPSHFGLILQHLRNVADGSSRYAMTMGRSKQDPEGPAEDSRSFCGSSALSNQRTRTCAVFL